MAITREQGIAYLMKDGNLKVPASRYGRNTEECASVAWTVAKYVADNTGGVLTEEALDYVMGLVVNDHDDVAYIISNYRRDG